MRELTQEEVDQVSAGPTPFAPIVATPTSHAAASSIPTYRAFADSIPFALPPLPDGKLS
jgi:hypothetical protein